MQRLFARAASPLVRIHLDEIGTFAWLRMDGTATVMEIADAMSQAFGERVAPVHDRITRFLAMLKHHRFVELRDGPTAAGSCSRPSPSP